MVKALVFCEVSPNICTNSFLSSHNVFPYETFFPKSMYKAPAKKGAETYLEPSQISKMELFVEIAPELQFCILDVILDV